MKIEKEENILRNIIKKKNLHIGVSRILKTKTGRLTKNQQNWIDDLNERGYKAECCYGLEKALDLIDWYFK